MVLDFSKSVIHKPCKAPGQKHSDEEVQKVIFGLMKENGIDADNFRVNEQGVTELTGIPPMKLHTLMLKAEELGLEVKYTKKTLIEVC